MQVEQDTRCDADFDFDVRGSTIGEFVESRVWPAARVHGMLNLTLLLMFVEQQRPDYVNTF
jgi:hypothetical protein